jgi:hypothetical protein
LVTIARHGIVFHASPAAADFPIAATLIVA